MPQSAQSLAAWFAAVILAHASLLAFGDETTREAERETQPPSEQSRLFDAPSSAGGPVAEIALLPPVEDQGLPSLLEPQLEAEAAKGGPPAGMPRGTRDGFFQRVTLDSRWTPAMRSGQPDVVDASATVVFALPAPSRRSPLLLTPGFASHSIGGPSAFDLPEQLYDATFEIGWLSQLTERWGVNVAVTPGVYSDFQQSDGDALRITGRLLASWKWTPTAKVIVGAVYLDRDDVAALPAAGLVWTPSEDWRLDLIAPRPKIARRLFCSEDAENWLYVSGEFGGGSWSVERAGGAVDVLNYRAYHLLGGWERKHFGAVSSLLEFGLAFGREFEYDLGGESFLPDESLVLRGRLQY